MSGIYGSHPFDRYYEEMLDRYLSEDEEEDEPDPDEKYEREREEKI